MTEHSIDQAKLATELLEALGVEGVIKLKGLFGGDAFNAAAAGSKPALGIEASAPRAVDGVEVDGAGFSDSTSVSTMSWADMVEANIPVAGVPTSSAEVKSTVVLGGFGVAGQPAAVPAGGGLMQQFVRTPLAKLLREKLAEVGIRMPKQSAYLLALCTHTAATMPAFFVAGKDKLKTLASLGDAALVAAVCASSIQSGALVESTQQLRSTRLTDAHMARVFVKSRFVPCVTVGAGVELKHAKTGATALEAIVGVVAYYRPPADVRLLARAFGLF